MKDLLAEKPVLLVHSSITCPVSRDNCPHVDRIQKEFGDKIQVVAEGFEMAAQQRHQMGETLAAERRDDRAINQGNYLALKDLVVDLEHRVTQLETVPEA